MPQLAIGALVAAGAATAFASAATIAAGGAFLFAAGTAAAFFAKTFVVAFVSGYLIQELAPKPSQPRASGAGGVRGSSQIIQDSVIPKRWILGRARVNGALVWFRHLDDRLASVLVLSEGNIDSIERIWVEGEEVEMVRDGNVLTPAPGSRFIYRRPMTRTITYYDIEYVGLAGDGGGDGPGRDTADPGSGYTGGGIGRPGDDVAGGGWGSSTGHMTELGESPPTGDGELPPDGGVPGERGGRYAPPNIPHPQRQGEGGGRVDPRPPNALKPGYRRVRKTRTVTTYTDVPTIKITEYFEQDADGIHPAAHGARIREIAAEALPTDAATEATTENQLAWTTEHQLSGASYVLVELLQPPYEETTEGVQGRLFNRIPALEFQVKGIKVSYPVPDDDAPGGRRMKAPEWTENAAVLRYWYLTTRRFVDSSQIDPTYFDSAVAKCDEPLVVPRASVLQYASYLGLERMDGESQSDFEARVMAITVKRYTINGVVNSGDSAQALERQFDLCWQGNVVEWSGGFLFRPGCDLPSRDTIDEGDIIGDPVIRPTLPRESRANEVSVEIEQSIREDFRAAQYRVVDTVTQRTPEEGGERLVIDIGRQSFLNEPVSALNILHQQLHQQRASMSVDITVKPKDDFRYVGLVPGDKIQLRLPEYGVGVGTAGAEGASSIRYFRVVSNQVNPDFSVNLRLTQWPDDWFDDVFVFPAVAPRQLVLPAPVAPPVASEPVYITHAIGQDGTITWEVVLYFETTHHTTIVQASSPLTSRVDAQAIIGEARFVFDTPGTYTFNAYNVASDGRTSSSITATAAATYVGIPLPTPVVDDVQQIGNSIQMQVQNIPNRDIVGMEVKYSSGALTADLTTLEVLTLDTWDDANEFNVAVTVPRDDARPLYGQSLIRNTGSYRVFVRLVSNTGNKSPIAQVGFFRYEVPAGAADSRTANPSWPGSQQNMTVWPHDGNFRLVPDRANRDAVTFDQWDGAPDWPFGQNTGFNTAYSNTNSTAYLTRVFDLETNVSREMTVTVELDSPEGVTNDVSDVEITLLHSTTPRGIAISPSTTKVDDGQPTTIRARAVAARVHLRTTRSNALVSLTVGWRELV